MSKHAPRPSFHDEPEMSIPGPWVRTGSLVLNGDRYYTICSCVTGLICCLAESAEGADRIVRAVNRDHNFEALLEIAKEIMVRVDFKSEQRDLYLRLKKAIKDAQK